MFRLVPFICGVLLVLSAVSCNNQATNEETPATAQTQQTQQAAQTEHSEPEKKTEPIPPSLELQGEPLTHYIALQETLAADDFEGALAAAKSLEGATESRVKSMAATMAAAKDINALRAHFRPLSLSMKDQALPEGYVTAYCPMAFDNTGGYWLQKSGSLANPYYGAEMLTCGAVTRRGGEAAEKKPEE